MSKPVYQYVSDCCNSTAKKPACVKSEKADSTLGTWRCGQCGKKCKVTRKANN